jgi:translocation and assembly module TamB
MDTSGSNLFTLAHPARVMLQRGRGAQRSWDIETSPFDWQGEGRQIQLEGFLDWPRVARAKVALRGVQSEWITSLFTNQVDAFAVQQLDAVAGWTNGPAVFGVNLQASGLGGSQFPLTGEAKFGSDGRELVITNLVVNSRTAAVTVITGRLPVRFNPGRSNLVAVDLKAPLELKASTEPRAIIWEKLASWTGLTLQEPACEANLAGTWAAPVGTVHLQARRMQFRQPQAEIPSLENLKIDLQLDRERARLTDGQLLVQGQPVTLTGEFPLGESFWNGLREKRMPSWENASAQLRVDNAQLAAFAPLLPGVLSPQGELDLELSLVPGGKLDGNLSVNHGRTRPLGTLGPIRDISVQMKFVERTLKLESARADVGGAQVLASGSADLSGAGWLRGVAPPFDFALRGTNVPLSRQPESIIRSDLDLSVRRTNQEPALISGTVRLRDSFYLRDVRDLVPGRVASPNRRPPYFSVDTTPLADWRLAARVSGTRFLKVRSTLFNGEISANLRLEGTLREPVALGDLKVDSGTVRFPFASLGVRQGFVTLTSSDPHRPRLELQAVSKKFGYELRMDASGPADAPVLQFNSTPPLNAEQIVLMLTAGEVPRGTLSLTPQQKAQTVAVFFGRDLLARLGFGDDSEDRLTFQSGEQVSEQGRPTYNVEYKLSDRWSLVGEYDRFNAFNAGLKWRVYSR